MNEIITMIIMSGGIGFLNVYLAGLSGDLSIGNFNKEDRISWLAIFTAINVGLFNLTTMVSKFFWPLGVVTGIVSLIVSIVLSFWLPKILLTLANTRRTKIDKVQVGDTPVLDKFQEQFDSSTLLFVFDLDTGRQLLEGDLVYGTDDRQKDLSLISRPFTSYKTRTYDVFMQVNAPKSGDTLEMAEYINFDKKIRFIKVRDYDEKYNVKNPFFTFD